MKVFNVVIILILSILIVSCALCRGTYLPNELKGTSWRLVSIVSDNNKEYIEEEILSSLDFTEKEFDGMPGCNSFFGNYKVKDFNKICFSVTGSTLMICEDHIQKYEDVFMSRIEKVESFLIDENTLNLYIDDSNYLEFFRYQKIDNEGLFGDNFTKIIWVGSERKPCQSVALQQCLLVKEQEENKWRLFYDKIEGFDWEKGYQYKLLIEETPIENPPADTRSSKLRLIEILEKIKISS